MKILFCTISALTVAWAMPAAAALVYIQPTSVSASGSFSGDIASLTDGVYPPDGQDSTVGNVYGFSEGTIFTIEFGELRTVSAFNITVDNDDDYTVSFFNGSAQVGSGYVFPSLGRLMRGCKHFRRRVS